MEHSENKAVILETSINALDQHGRKNTSEISGIQALITDDEPENKVVKLFETIDILVSSSDIEAFSSIHIQAFSLGSEKLWINQKNGGTFQKQ